MDLLRKKSSAISIKEDAQGEATVVIATKNNGPDSDGDTYAKEVLGGEQSALILPAHDSMSVPLGKARVYESPEDIRADMKFNLDIPAADQWFKALQFDMTNGKSKQEYSFGYRILKSSPETIDGQRVQQIEKLDIFEVSPVVRGAGNHTRTVDIKSEKDQVAEIAAANATIFGSEVRRIAQRWGITV